MHQWRVSTKAQAKPSNKGKEALPEKIDQQIVTAASPPTLRAGLYVCDIRFTFAHLEKDRHSELTMRVFNGTGSVVEFSNVQGASQIQRSQTIPILIVWEPCQHQHFDPIQRGRSLQLAGMGFDSVPAGARR